MKAPSTFRPNQVVVAKYFLVMLVCGVFLNSQNATAQGLFQNLFDPDGDTYGWINHTEGEQLGDVAPFTSLGLSRIKWESDGLWLFSGQGLVSNDGDPGGSLGVVRRFWLGPNTFVGGGFFYDINQSQNENNFQQTVFSTDLVRDDWAFRSNVYLPVGPQVRNIVSQNFGNNNTLAFQGHNILASGGSLSIDEVAMKGIDIEIARSIGNTSGEIFAGYYNFTGRIGEDTNGAKVGARGYVTPRLAGNIQIADDPLFGTNVYGGFTFFFGGVGGNRPQSIQHKMTIPVERNQQVVVNQVVTQDFFNNAILTDQGRAITVNHVNDSGAAGDGTIENPHGSLTDADNDPDKNKDIVYLHSGTTFNDQSYQLTPDQRFLGEGGGNQHVLNTDQGVFILPSVNGIGNPTPLIRAIDGQFALNANNNTEISNLRINNTGPGLRAGIFADGNNLNLNRIDITGGEAGIVIRDGTGQFTFTDLTIATDPTGYGLISNGAGVGPGFTGNMNVNRLLITGGERGIDIMGGTGTFTFTDTEITNTTDRGLSVSGGNANIIFNGLSNFNNNSGSTIRIGGGHQGTASFNSGTNITATDGDGLKFDVANGQYDFQGNVQLNGGDAGIDILNSSAGTFTFTDTTIIDPAGTGLNVGGGNATVNFGGTSSITKNNTGSAVNVNGLHTGNINFDTGTSITATAGNGLQFDNSDGDYDFRGQIQLNGGDAGIDILGGSAGTFTFTNTDITNPTGTGINIDGGSSTFTFDGLSSITKNNPGSTLRVRGGHSGTVTFNPNTGITATDGNGLQFDNADGDYDFRGQVQLNGGNAGIDILGDSAGTFTFTDTTITNPTGIGIDIDGGSSTFTFDGLSSITKNNPGSTLRVRGGHSGTVTFNPNTGITATDGNGLQFDNADGDYDFRGQVQLNGGDAGIDILGGSAGTFTFSDTTTITNPTGAAFNVQDLEAGGTINYNGSLQNDNDVFLSIDTTAAGSQINFNNTGGNSLTSTDNPNGAIFIFDADGDITITTPTTIIRPGFSSLFATDGDGTWTFNDMTITDQMGLNGGIDVFGNQGTVNFTNLNITTDSAGTGDATTGFLAGGNNEINVLGNNNNIFADGGGALVLVNINTINMTFENVTSTNNLNSQIGFAGDDGIDLLNVGAGTLDITGLTRIENADGVGISIEDTGATVTFELIDLDNIGQDGIIAGVAFDSPGIININGGLVNNTGGDGARIGSGGFGSGVLGGFNLNNTTFTNIGGSVVELSNSTLSGAGNIAVPFTCNNLGNNVGEIFFNGGGDSCGQ